MTRKFIPKRKGRPKLCTYPGCRRVTTTGRCSEHTVAKVGSKWAKESKKFLNSAAWLNLRALKIQKNPWCEECEKHQAQPVPATQVDHIKPRHSHPELKLVASNLQSLCDRCHGEKTARGQ